MASVDNLSAPAASPFVPTYPSSFAKGGPSVYKGPTFDPEDEHRAIARRRIKDALSLYFSRETVQIIEEDDTIAVKGVLSATFQKFLETLEDPDSVFYQNSSNFKLSWDGRTKILELRMGGAGIEHSAFRSTWSVIYALLQPIVRYHAQDAGLALELQETDQRQLTCVFPSGVTASHCPDAGFVIQWAADDCTEEALAGPVDADSEEGGDGPRDRKEMLESVHIICEVAFSQTYPAVIDVVYKWLHGRHNEVEIVLLLKVKKPRSGGTIKEWEVILEVWRRCRSYEEQIACEGKPPGDSSVYRSQLGAEEKLGHIVCDSRLAIPLDFRIPPPPLILTLEDVLGHSLYSFRMVQAQEEATAWERENAAYLKIYYELLHQIEMQPWRHDVREQLIAVANQIPKQPCRDDDTIWIDLNNLQSALIFAVSKSIQDKQYGNPENSEYTVSRYRERFSKLIKRRMEHIEGEDRVARAHTVVNQPYSLRGVPRVWPKTGHSWM